MRTKKKSKSAVIAAAIILPAVIALIIFGVIYGADKWQRATYPLRYSEYVEGYSAQFGLDKYMVYAFIQTESGFDTQAESYLGARGLMQIMPETFEWIRYRLGEENDPAMTYDRMYEAKENIRYGCYLLSYLSDEFGSGLTEISAAYHAGNGTVSSWLSDDRYSADGKLTTIPNSDTAHYAEKIERAYNAYCRLYKN